MSFDQCELLRELSLNIKYQSLIAFKCTLCIFGVIGIGYQWSKQGVRFLIHNNTKIIFTFFYALNFIIAFAFSLFYVFELVRLRFNCFFVYFRTVLLLKGTGISAVIAAHHIVLLLSLERLYSSIFPTHFERTSSKKLAFLLSITLNIISWFFSMSHMSNGFTLFGELPVAMLEERIEVNSKSYDVLVIMVISTNIFSLIVFSIDFYLNFIRKIPGVNSSLSISYQRSENRRVILIILPIESTYSLLTLTTTIALISQEQIIDVTIPMERMLYLEIFTFPMYFPLILSIVIELLVARRVRVPVTHDVNDVDHFDNLRRAWNQ